MIPPKKKLNKKRSQKGTSCFYILLFVFATISVISITLSVLGLLAVSKDVILDLPERILNFFGGATLSMQLNNPSTPTTTIQYDTLIARAAYLADKYKNITSLHPKLLEHANILKVLEMKSKLPASSIVDIADISKTSAHKLGGLAAPKSRQSISPNNNIVIGIAQDIDPKNFVVFCGSFRENIKDTKTDAVIFINSPVHKRNREIANRFNVKLLEYDLEKEFIEETYFRKYHPSTLRWKLIYKYFTDENRRMQYQQVVMIDVRDSYFQSDPFVTIFPTNDGVTTSSFFFVFQGVESIKISDCGWNGGWVKDCFGNEALSKIGSQAIICSGISMGSMNVVYEYLGLMSGIVSGHSSEAESKGFNGKFPTCERNGVDQGVHNVLIHGGLVRNVKIFSQSNGLVANMQAKMARVDGQVVSNTQGDKVSVVHQYDRNPKLQSDLFKKYVYWLDSGDLSAVWNDEPTCQKFQYQENVDLFKGVCDFKMRGGASSAATCCEACNSTPENKCEAFTFYSGACFLKSCGKGGARSPRAADLQGAISGFLK